MVNLQGCCGPGAGTAAQAMRPCRSYGSPRQTDATGLGLRVRRLAGLKLIGTRRAERPARPPVGDRPARATSLPDVDSHNLPIVGSSPTVLPASPATSGRANFRRSGVHVEEMTSPSITYGAHKVCASVTRRATASLCGFGVRTQDARPAQQGVSSRSKYPPPAPPACTRYPNERSKLALPPTSDGS
jgi:hypothetical protein